MDKASRKPTRYILLTSQSLSPARKTELRAALKPYCKRTSDILGVDDIEGIIVKNPSIEEYHYKLWLSGTRVLSQILGNAALTRSEIRVDELLQRARLFVEPAAMPEAERILRAEKSLIISGAPGIGKTTLAEMLALRFLNAGYRVYFPATVSEIEERTKKDDKELFIFDDFLGRTNLREAPPTSDQERLFAFMRHIRRVSNKYLVLTTREYMFKEARAANERLTINRADIIKCLLDVSGYDRNARAKILYNHLYWSPGIATPDLVAFVKDRGYERVIAHPDFNPRFIADTINRIASIPKVDFDEDGEDLWTSKRN